jgi:type VI secretion system protein ImpA
MDLYPLADDGDFDERIGNLRWLVSRIPALMRVWRREHGPVPRSDADYCAAMLQQLEQVSDRRLGSEGPSLLQRTKVYRHWRCLLRMRAQ